MKTRYVIYGDINGWYCCINKTNSMEAYYWSKKTKQWEQIGLNPIWEDYYKHINN